MAARGLRLELFAEMLKDKDLMRERCVEETSLLRAFYWVRGGQVLGIGIRRFKSQPLTFGTDV